jgi:hypothetical protein
VPAYGVKVFLLVVFKDFDDIKRLRWQYQSTVMQAPGVAVRQHIKTGQHVAGKANPDFHLFYLLAMMSVR